VNDEALFGLDFKRFASLPNDETVERTKESLKKNNMNVIVVNSKEEALKAVVNLIPEGASVNMASSISLEDIGFKNKLFNENDKNWKNLNAEILSKKTRPEMFAARRQASTVDYFLTSANSITEDGVVVICDNSGSRVGPIPFSASNVIFVVGSQKITKNESEALERQYQFSLPLESSRYRFAMNMPKEFKSSCNHNLSVRNTAVQPGRINVIIVKERIGY